MFGKSFWVNLFERAISTFAQAAIGVLSAGSLGLLHVNWMDVVSVAGLAALLSVLKSFSVVAAASPDKPVPTGITVGDGGLKIVGTGTFSTNPGPVSDSGTISGGTV